MAKYFTVTTPETGKDKKTRFHKVGVAFLPDGPNAFGSGPFVVWNSHEHLAGPAYGGRRHWRLLREYRSIVGVFSIAGRSLNHCQARAASRLCRSARSGISDHLAPC